MSDDTEKKKKTARDVADALWGCNELEIPADGKVELVDGGAWVSARIWVEEYDLVESDDD